MNHTCSLGFCAYDPDEAIEPSECLTCEECPYCDTVHETEDEIQIEIGIEIHKDKEWENV